MRVKNVVKETLGGLQEAEKLYKQFVKQEYWNEPPEYLSTICIARRLSKNLEFAVSVEDRIGRVLDEARKAPGPPKRNLKLRGRFDIVVWGYHGPIGIIEVKKVWSLPSDDAEKKDLKRICAVLDKAKSIQWGLFAYITADWTSPRKTAHDKLTTFTDKVYKTIKDFVTTGCGIRSRNKGTRRHTSDIVLTQFNESGRSYERGTRAEVIEISRKGGN